MGMSLYNRQLLLDPYCPALRAHSQYGVQVGDCVPIQDCVRLVYLTEGCCTLLVGEEEIKPYGNCMLLLDADVRCLVYSADKKCRLGVLAIDFVPCDQTAYTYRQMYREYPAFRETIALAKRAVCLIDTGGAMNFALQTFQVYTQAVDAQSDMDTSGITSLSLSLLLAVIGKNEAGRLEKSMLKSEGQTHYVRRALLYIQNYYSQDIRAADIAENVGINQSYLHRMFTKEMGLSINTYINILRMNMAARMMVRTSLSIQSISNMVGVKSQQYFSSLFKKHYDMSPLDYRTYYASRKYPPGTDVQEYLYVSGQLMNVETIKKDDLSGIISLSAAPGERRAPRGCADGREDGRDGTRGKEVVDG